MLEYGVNYNFYYFNGITQNFNFGNQKWKNFETLLRFSLIFLEVSPDVISQVLHFPNHCPKRKTISINAMINICLGIKHTHLTAAETSKMLI